MKSIKQIVQSVHYSTPVSLFWSILFGLPSLCYLFAISFKNLLYTLRILKETKVDAKVICVGNITTGGVGKTPIVCALANKLVQDGKKVAVISRGYGGKLDNRKVHVVNDINDATLCGDEPYLIVKNTQNVPVLTCRDRVLAANYAIKHFGAEVILLDDGFSNRKIYKDVNILVVDSEKKFGNSYVLPLGPLREPLIELKRADKFVVADKNAQDSAKTLSEFTRFNKPVYLCKMVKEKYYNPKTKKDYVPSAKPRALAFCAIGQPEQFYNYLEEDFEIVKTLSFSDHHVYSEADNKQIQTLATEYDAKILLTTEKDAIKLRGVFDNLYVLKLKLDLDLEGLLNENDERS